MCRLGTSTLISACLALTAATSSRADQVSAVTPEVFLATVFGDWGGDTPLIRVTTPVDIVLTGDTSVVDPLMLSGLAADLTQVTGLAVSWPDAYPEGAIVARFEIALLPLASRAVTLDRRWISQRTSEMLQRFPCGFVTRGRSTVLEALILIDPTLPADTLAHCLVEEVAQSFGAFHDTDLLARSAFNDHGDLVEALQPSDRRILELLFDARIVPGMTRNEVAAILPDIMAD